MNCPTCACPDVPPAARFCPECGAKLPEPPAPAAQIAVTQEVGSIQGGQAIGAQFGPVTGDVTIESTVNQIEARLVEGDYVDRRTITNQVLVLGPDALEEIVKRLAALQGVDKGTLQRLGAQAVPEHVSRQITEVVAAQKEAAARGVPATPQAAYRLGTLAAYDRDYDAALDYFRQAVGADPEYADAFEAIAWLQQSRARDDFIIRRDYEAAAARLAEARAAAMHTDPLNASALALRGYVAGTLAQLAQIRHDQTARAKYHAEAARLFEQATRLDPNDPSAQNGLGNALAEMGDLNAAIAAYNRAIELQPAYASAYHDLALAYESKMQADPAHSSEWRQKALAAWRKTYELAPEDSGFSADYIVTIGRRIRRLQVS
jgi:tetratricopeptide (TPR) repeat protein